jgi:hypothetical protein
MTFHFLFFGVRIRTSVVRNTDPRIWMLRIRIWIHSTQPLLVWGRHRYLKEQKILDTVQLVGGVDVWVELLHWQAAQPTSTHHVKS